MDFVPRSHYFDTLEVFSFAMYTVGMGNPATELNERQWKFVDEYVKTSHATNSAAAAGYSERSAHVQGSRLLRNERVSFEVHKRFLETLIAETTDDVSLWALQSSYARHMGLPDPPLPPWLTPYRR